MAIRQVHPNLQTFVHANSLCLNSLIHYSHIQVQLIFHDEFESPLNLKQL